MAANIHVGDVGTAFRVTMVDQDGAVMSLATNQSITYTFERPDGTSFNRVGVLFTDGTDGITQYATVDGDLDVDGRWQYQVYVVLPSGKWHTTVVVFKVKPNLP